MERAGRLGYEAAAVSEEDLAGAPDHEIVAVAAAGARILITLDKGIANLVRHPPVANHARESTLANLRPLTHFTCCRNVWFSLHMNSISSWSTTSR